MNSKFVPEEMFLLIDNLINKLPQSTSSMHIALKSKKGILMCQETKI